jgi:hypothetical protein
MRSCFFFFASPPSFQMVQNNWTAKIHFAQQRIAFGFAPSQKLFLEDGRQLAER